MQRGECGRRLLAMLLDAPSRGLNLRERGLATLDAETRDPPQRGALEPVRLGFANDDADCEGITQVDVRQLALALRMIAMLPVFRARRKRSYADP